MHKITGFFLISCTYNRFSSTSPFNPTDQAFNNNKNTNNNQQNVFRVTTISEETENKT